MLHKYHIYYDEVVKLEYILSSAMATSKEGLESCGFGECIEEGMCLCNFYFIYFASSSAGPIYYYFCSWDCLLGLTALSDAILKMIV